MPSLPSLLPRWITGFRPVQNQDLSDLRDWLCSFTGSSGGSDPGPLTAKAGGGQALATVLPSAINEVGTVASNNDSVQLPVAQPGMAIAVINNGASSLQVFGSSVTGNTDTINGTAGATGVAQLSGKTAVYYCPRVGVWFRDLSA